MQFGEIVEIKSMHKSKSWVKCVYVSTGYYSTEIEPSNTAKVVEKEKIESTSDCKCACEKEKERQIK